MTTVEQGFVKAQSDNLPKLDTMCMFSFLGQHPDFVGAEMKNVKAKRSGRESYGDNAIGYVQVKRENSICTVKAKVTPEHRIKKKAYSVSLVCDEEKEEIVSVQCEDCAASLGGCKHSIALLTWVHRRSEEPPRTSTQCYWKKSKLSKIASGSDLLKAKDMSDKASEQLPYNADVLKNLQEECKKHSHYDSVLTKYWKNNDSEKLSLHYLLQYFFSKKLGKTAEEFLIFCGATIDESKCQKAQTLTIGQSKNALWNELRYARITASKIHEVVRCKTSDGVLVETILGAYPIKDTNAMKRGRDLEEAVRKQIEKNTDLKLSMCGLMISEKYPVIGASADAITDECVVEIKCPASEKTMQNYAKDGVIGEKYVAQMQLQMYVHKKQKGLFCIAHPDFEKSKSIDILYTNVDIEYCKDLIEKSIEFWKKIIFPVIKQNYD